MPDRDIVARIHRYNRGRETQRLEMKFERMAADPFTFFRGTCHLFYGDLPPGDAVFRDAPAAWICGDLHLENFGSYKGDNGLSYFDINDFDEGGLAPATWDISRFLTSLWLAAEEIGLRPKQRLALEVVFLDAYVGALVDGKARWVERATATGMVRDLLDNLQARRDFLDSRTERKKGAKRRLKLDAARALPVAEPERRSLGRWMADFAGSQTQPGFFDLVDVARRVAGTGSLGVRRYVLLVEGKGSPNGNYLLDLKQALPSSLEPHFPLPQPAWEGPAVRAVAIQQRMQAIAQALLQPVRFDGGSWILRELQPTKDRLRLGAWEGKLSRLEGVLQTMGELVAWAQLRSSGRQGAATADALSSFASRRGWREDLVRYAQAYSETVKEDWRTFRRSRTGAEGVSRGVRGGRE